MKKIYISKNKKVSLLFIIILITGILPYSANASEITVKARLDSVNLLMGKLMNLHLEVVENKGSKGSFRIFNDSDRAKGYASVCGDSVELRCDYSIDTVELGSGKVQLNYTVPVQAFDSGTFTLPPLAYAVGNDTAYANQLTFNVVPVSVTAEDPISGFAPVAEPDGNGFFDWVPDWILDFWWIWLIIFLSVCAFIYALKNYKKGGLEKILSKPVLPPWQEALAQLHDLKERKLWEQGLEKQYFTELTDILRVYLFKRFGINAMEMTTSQIMNIILQSDFKDKKDYMRHILNVADFVKFAKVRPLPADNIAAYDNAVNFVNETIPSTPEESEAKSHLKNTQPEGGDNP